MRIRSYMFHSSTRRIKKNINHINNKKNISEDVNNTLFYLSKVLIEFLYLSYSVLCLIVVGTLVKVLIDNYSVSLLIGFILITTVFLFFAIYSIKSFIKTKNDQNIAKYAIVVIVLTTLIGLFASVITIFDFFGLI